MKANRFPKAGTAKRTPVLAFATTLRKCVQIPPATGITGIQVPKQAQTKAMSKL